MESESSRTSSFQNTPADYSQNNIQKKRSNNLFLGIMFEFIILLIIFLFVILLNYFNFLSLSSMFPEYLGWLPREEIETTSTAIKTMEGARNEEMQDAISSQQLLLDYSKIVLEQDLHPINIINPRDEELDVDGGWIRQSSMEWNIGEVKMQTYMLRLIRNDEISMLFTSTQIRIFNGNFTGINNDLLNKYWVDVDFSQFSSSSSGSITQYIYRNESEEYNDVKQVFVNSNGSNALLISCRIYEEYQSFRDVDVCLEDYPEIINL